LSVSVIIPTYNRADVLRKTLAGFSSQSGDNKMLEVLIVDDGSTDDTRCVVEECSHRSSVPFRYLYQDNRGQGAARNHGIREAHGKLLLFTDDDIIPSPGMVAQHLAWHEKHPEASVGVLGSVVWAPELRPTPFMVWSGLYDQFHFGYFKPGMELKFWDAYIGNTSMKAAFLRRHGTFDEKFHQYGWEEVELNYRLYQAGFRMLYNPEALGYHYKYEKFEDALRRIGKARKSWPAFTATAAGKCFLEQAGNGSMSCYQQTGSGTWSMARRTKSLLRKLSKPLKPPLMWLLRHIADTHVPLPSRLYSTVLYYYVDRTYTDASVQA
jgi:glycosyltransferase involved in cell wall biosynthesis